ncbi:helix-turn-helix transcriptional regulator [Altererythrobacter sp.]|nr:helix-turn-helix transcriptional regulator [Altererythrobacter sp.]
MLHVDQEWAQQPHLRLTIHAPLSAMCSLAVSKPSHLGLRFMGDESHSGHIRLKLRLPCQFSDDRSHTDTNTVRHKLEIRHGRTSLYAQGSGLERHHVVDDLPTSYYRRRLTMLFDAVQLPKHIFRQIASVQLMSIGRFAYNPSSRTTMNCLEHALTIGETREACGMTMSELAAHVGMTACEFSKKFKQKFGSSPHSYFNMVRLGEAHACLSTPDRTLADTAYLLGFSNQAHFTTVFKRLTGLPPGEYREKMLQQVH